jgi:histidine ammonia-lyase
MRPDPVVLTDAGLTLGDLRRVAVEGAPLRLTDERWERVVAGRLVVERTLAGEALVYGLNTGLGHLRDERVARERLMEYQRCMVRDHAGGVGRPLADAEVRAIIVARVAGLARGGAGVHPDAIRALLGMLEAGVHPLVPEVGSVGAADLMHLAAVALVVMGEGQARVGGEVLSGGEALRRAGLAPYVPQPKDGLALVSASSAAVGLGALAVLEAERAARLADVSAALALEAVAANLSPFDDEVARAKPVEGQIAVAAHLRELLAGSRLETPAVLPSVQDALSFRVVPQVHGAFREQLAAARHAVEVELNASADNPLVSVETDRVVSNGNFQPVALALAVDAARVGLAHVAVLSERRAQKLLAARVAGVEGLFADPARARPPLLVAYAAAALLAEVRHLAAPVSLQAPPLDLDVEDHATLAPLAVALLRRAVDGLEAILAIEALLAVDALEAQPAARPLGTGTGAAHSAVLEVMADGAPAAAALVDAVRDRLRELAAEA